MVESCDKGLPEGLEVGPAVEEALRYAAVEPFETARLEKNERIIEERILALETRGMAQPLSRGRFRVAFAVGAIFGLFSIGASALFLYEKYCEWEERGDAVEAPVIQEEVAKPRTRGKSRRVPAAIVRKTQAESPVERDTQAPRPRRTEREPRSVIDKQLKLFKSAKQLAEQGRHQQAVSKLDLLDSRYSGGPLDVESKELRARCLVHLKRFVQAERLVEGLIRDSRSNRKKAALVRFLGDIQAQRGRCDEAVRNYRRALGLGLRPADSTAAKNGIAKCSP